MTKCPCEECISFAICYNSIIIKCESLHKYLFVYQSGYVNYIQGRGDVVYELYKKYIHRVDVMTFETYLTENKDVRDIRYYIQ